MFLKSLKPNLLWVVITSEWTVLIYMLINFFLPGMVSADYFLYVYQPILWSALAILAWLAWRYGLSSRPKLKLPLVVTISLLAIFQIAVLIIAGLMLGFGYSPYNHQPAALLRNVLYVVTSLAGIEMLRAYLVNRFKQNHPWIIFILVSLIFSLLRVTPATLAQMDTLQSTLQIIGERLVPTIAQNLLATLLVMIGGPLASIIYLGILQLFEWLMPILPNLGWFVNAAITTVIPAYGLVIVYNQFIAVPMKHEEMEAHKEANFTSWAVVAVFTLVLVGFSTGLFGVRPSLIGSSSMSPSILVGDIVVARDVPLETIKVGDVITYRRDGATVVHRVIDIQNNSGQIIMITRGDANDSADPPIQAGSYKGKVVFTIPKIGWISIFVRSIVLRLL